jgi:thiol-disulfide isomerase/thioredoxin
MSDVSEEPTNVLPTIMEVPSLQAFSDLLANNPGLVIIKLGATWCAPCQRIEAQVKHFMGRLPGVMQGVIVDVDESFEFYAFLQKKKVTKGIPSILCYVKGNNTHVPDDTCLGSKTDEVNAFYERCYKRMNLL